MKKQRLLYLDIVRVIAVITVLVCHYTRELEYQSVGFVTKLLPDYPFGVYLGSLGVSLFFIISGASLMYVSGEKLKIGTFYKKRFLNIYPMFWIAYLLAFLYNFWENRGMQYLYPKSRFLLTLFGMDGYTEWFGANYYLLGEWFLGCLIFLYLLFPLLRMGTVKYPKQTVVIAAVIYLVGSILGKMYDGVGMPVQCWFFMRIPEFLFGMYFVRYIKTVSPPLLVGSLAVLAVTAVVDFRWIGAVHITVVVGIASFLFLVFVSKYLEFMPIQKFCGLISKYSYAVFLSHHFLYAKILPHFNGIVLSRSGVYFTFAICICVIAVVSKLLLWANDKVLRLRHS
ncbi:acyltransferase [Clostridia bacterium]|nr:acyltransferase [Clostridia bacterium]